jgi:DNA repair protein RadC
LKSPSVVMKSLHPIVGAQKPHYHGHRQRLRQKFHDHGSLALADYELIELLLCLALARGDVKPLAKTLLARFKKIPALLAADSKILLEIEGVGPTVVHVLKLAQAVALRAAQQEVMGKIVLQSWAQVIEYCTVNMAYNQREQLRLLFLDSKNHLIAEEVLQDGTVDHLPIYPREVIRRTLDVGASAIILVHNHPSGDPTPSRADIDATLKLQKIARELGINVHDHLIIGQGQHISMKGLGIL